MKNSTSSADKAERQKGQVGAISTQDDATLRREKSDQKAPLTEAERTGGGNPRGPKETQAPDGEADGGKNRPASYQPSGGTTNQGGQS